MLSAKSSRSRRRGVAGDHGAISIIVALFVSFVLLVIAGLVIDVGRLYNTRAQLQNGADAAALAGVAKYTCFSSATTGVVEAANAIAAQNETAVQSVTPNGNAKTVQVITQALGTPLLFGQLINRTNQDVFASATAKAVCDGGYAVFSGQADFATNGGINITGSLYSADDAKFTGQNIVTQSIDIAGSIQNGNNVCTVDVNGQCPAPTPVNVGQPLVEPECFAYKIGLDGDGGDDCSPARTPSPDSTMLIQQGRLGNVKNAAGVVSSGPVLNGTTAAQCTVNAAWYTANPTVTYLNCNRDVAIATYDGSRALRGIESTGKIAFTSTVTMGDINTPVIVFSTSTNLGPPAGGAIEVQGSSTATVWGYVYAPRGKILVDGSNNLTVKGKTIGEAITLNGTGSQAFDGAYFSGTPTFKLTE